MGKIKTLAVCALACLLIPGLASCGGQGGQDETSVTAPAGEVKINLEFNSDGGSITYAKKDYKIGDVLVLEVKINKGYSLAKLHINDKKIRPTDGSYLYRIDSEIVNIYGLFEKNKVLMSDFIFEFDDTNNTAKIKKYSPDRNIIPYPFILPETVEYANKTYVIDTILQNAFQSSSVEQIQLSKNIKNIELETFANVHGLKSILVDKANPYFVSYNDSLYSKNFDTLIAVPCEHQQLDYQIKDGTKTIAPSAMMNVRLITNVNVPNSVTKINDKAFMSMPSLISADLSSAITNIPSNCFANDVNLDHIVIPEGVTSLSDYAFYFCPELKQVSFPSTLKEIGAEAFYNCEKLQDFTLNEGLQVIKKSAFGHCISLRNVVMPKSLLRLEDAVFETCQGLVNVALNEGLQYLGGAVFILTPLIRLVVIPSSVTEIHYNPFIGTGFGELSLAEGNLNYTMVDGVLFSKDLTKLISFPYNLNPNNGEYVIPSTVIELGYNAFSMNKNLKKLTIPTSVKKMVCAFEDNLPFDEANRIYELELHYEGSKEEFLQIDNGGIIFNYKAHFKGNVVHCNDGIILLSSD